jgi:hypothetical protein
VVYLICRRRRRRGKKKDNVTLLMATEKTTEIKSDIFFSYRAWTVPWDAPILAKNKDFFFPLSANADEMEANGPLKTPSSSFVSTYSKNAVPLANSDNTVSDDVMAMQSIRVWTL